ncbi:MAG TPA: permease-like cell division protein FtsX [Polyangiaceae bacterium]
MTPVERAWRGGRNDWRLHVLSVFSVAVAFVCLASALLLVVNVDAVRDRWSRTGRASVYLKASATPEQITSLEKALRATDGVTDVRNVSADQARRELGGFTSDETLLGALPVEAFPASLEVALRDDLAVSRLEKLSAQLSQLPAVESVETYQAWSERLAALLAGGVTAAGILALVVFAAVISVVSSTIRLSLQRRRVEVEVLKLVGATDAYVRRPFVLEGAAQGASGALLAIALLAVLYAVVHSRFDERLALLIGSGPSFLPWYLALSIVAVGAALGAVAAHTSIRKLLVV